MIVQHCLIRKLILYEFELVHNTMKITQSVCGAKGEGAIDHSTMTRWFKKFRLCYKVVDNQTRSGRPIAETIL